MRALVLPQKYETLQFEGYDELRNKFCDLTFDPEKLEELDASGKKHFNIPPLRPLKFLTNLIIIKLANNNISRFDPTNFVQGAPKLQVLDLHKNKIDVLDDLIELGTLKNLRELNILENPVCGYLLRIKIIQFLLFPEKYKPYDAVKILTATYESITTKTTLTPAEERERINYQRFMEKLPSEIDEKELRKSRVNKYDHKNTLIKKALAPCPVPRKTRFPNLQHINGKIISKADIESITLQPWNNIVYKGEEEFKQINQVHKIQHSDQHEKYLQKYKAKMERKVLEQGALLYLNKEKLGDAGNDDLKAISALDQENYNRRKIYGNGNLALWEKPADVKYKDAPGFSISIEEYKQMVKEYEAEKERKKQEKKKRIKRMREKIIESKRLKEKKKKMKAGLFEADVEDEASKEDEAIKLNESYHNIDSDPELKRLFNIKKKKRPKATLELAYNEVSFINSSESFLSEGNKDADHALSDDAVEKRMKTFGMSFCTEDEAEQREFTDGAKDHKLQKIESERKSHSQGNFLGKVRIAFAQDYGPNMDDQIAEDAKEENKEEEKKVRKKYFKKDQDKKAQREYKTQVFTTKEDLEYQERQKKRMEELEAKAQREIEQSKIKKIIGLTTSTIRKTVDKRTSGRNSKRGSHDASFESRDGDRTPMQRNPSIKLGADDHYRSQHVKAKFSQSDLGKIDEITPSNRMKFERPAEAFSSLQYNFSSLQKENENAEPGTQKSRDRTGTHKREGSGGEVKLTFSQHPSLPQQEEKGGNPLDYFNFTNLMKPTSEVDVISNIQSNSPSKDPSQAGDDVVEDVREALQIGEIKQTSQKEISGEVESKTQVKSIQVLEPETKDEKEQQDGIGNQVVTEFNQEMGQRATTLPDSLHDQAQTQTEFQNERIRTHYQQFPKASVYQTAQGYIQNRPGTSSVSSNLFNPNILLGQQRLGTSHPSHPRIRVQTIRKQEAKSYNIANKVFFNHAKEIEKKKQEMQTLPPAPPMKKLYGSSQRSTSSVRQSMPLSRQTTQPLVASDLKDSKGNEVGTLKSLTEEDFRPATSLRLVKSTTSRKLFDATPKTNLLNKLLPETRTTSTKEIDLIPPHLNVKPKPVTLESLIPRPEEGISEAMKLKILNERDENYEKLTEIVKLIEESNKIREEILSVLGPGSSSHIGTERKGVSFTQIADFLMQRSGCKKLTQEDKDDMRDLIFSVNDNKTGDYKAPKLTYKWIEERRNDYVKKGDRTYEIDKLYEYYDILKRIDDKKVNSKNTHMIKLLEKKEIERAEHNAVLAAHYQRLKKYCGEEFIMKHLKEYNTLNQNIQQSTEAHKPEKIKDMWTPEIILTTSGKYAHKESGTEFENRLKTKRNMDYTSGELKPIDIKGSWAEAWPNINQVFNSRKQKTWAVDRFEDLVETFQRKMADEYYQSDQKVLTMEEKMIKYAQDFKENSKKRQDLKQKIDKNIREIRKNLDEFIDVNAAENDRRHDKEYCFREYVKAVRDNQA